MRLPSFVGPRTPRLAGAALVALALAVSAAGAQQLPAGTLRRGQFVRVRPLDRLTPHRTGTLVDVDSATLTIRRVPRWTGQLVTVSLDSVRHIDVRLRPSRRLRGAAEGALFGTIVVASALWLSQADSGTEAAITLGAYPWLAPAAIGGGALLGWRMAPGARWERVR